VEARALNSTTIHTRHIDILPILDITVLLSSRAFDWP